MSYYTYNQYGRMTSQEKDRICDSNGEDLVALMDHNVDHAYEIDYNKQPCNATLINKNKQPFKRQLTSTSLYDDGPMEEHNNEQDDDQFITVSKNNKRKHRRTNHNNGNANNDDDLLNIEHATLSSYNSNGNNGRLFLNSKNRMNNNINDERSNVRSYHTTYFNNVQKQKSSAKEQNDKTNNNSNENNNNIEISNQAIKYAVENHLPPLKISCQPKVNQNEAKDLIKELLNYINKSFRLINKHYEYPLGFDYWYIDKNGDIACYTRHIELYVYLCDTQNYPSTLCNINIIPSSPKHLPPQYSIVLKFVPNYITQDEIRSEIATYIQSIYNIEEMKGSMTEKYRHIRLELTSSSEYNQIIKNGGVTINGHVLEAKEFLAPPRLLICTKCNDPGHTRNNCKFIYDACRRCGTDRTVGEHKECTIKCHRCQQNHLSTDYKCQFLVDYRRSLLYQLKEHPNLLPPNIQLFVPSECRNKNGQNRRMLFNPKYISKNLSSNTTVPFSLSSQQWPPLINNTNMKIKPQLNEQSVWIEMQQKQDEINKIREDMNIKIQNIQTKYEDHLKKMSSILLIISQQAKNQNESVERCYTTINEVLPILSSTLEVVQRIVKKTSMLNNNTNDSYETLDILSHITQSLDFIKDRNNLLSANQQALNSLVEQQNVLMVKGINSLITNDGQ
ncbi:unnamed protein product [Rotaria sp. Silwood2]|nr:unnamed protein product [Rotaria sp. Silwood2]CAF2735133.1 unnamed protein product [Rotaria sp. Silwood2]CAF3327945.1 unnamed protein product [Rotaria sp. Silwood2]CAF3360854.1 unnamed protein product [Rotaria sp. Silwood2]CAF4035344.1 unnamed protein product [Rotaria sp. Silwood2]